ncbi:MULTISPECIES: 23S rRNA methyltransferase attenuation leader peptide, partial [Enterococcus]
MRNVDKTSTVLKQTK